MVLKYNSQKPLTTSNGFRVQLTETGVLNFFHLLKTSTSNGFGVQLTKTISEFMLGA